MPGTLERSTQYIVEVLVAQHHQVDELFSRVLGADDDGRARMFAQLLHVLALHESVEHNRREESDEFPLLNQRLDASERTRLTRAVEELGKLAASGTEAKFEHAELAAGSPNMMVGPFAAILDRARRIIAESSEDRP
jgi:hypothetical protein